MGLFSRRAKLDPAVAAVIKAADPDERVVAWGVASGGRVVVATPRGLWWPLAGADNAAVRRIPWERVSKAVWRDGVLLVIEADVVDDLLLIDRSPAALPLEQPGQIPVEVKRRIDASVNRSEIVPVSGGQVRVVARRVPGQDGLTWWARLEGSTPDNVLVRDAVERAIAGFRAAERADEPA